MATDLASLQKKVVGRDSEISPTGARKAGLIAESGAAEVRETLPVTAIEGDADPSDSRTESDAQ